MKTSVPSACSILNKCQILNPWFFSHKCTIIERFQESSDNVPRRFSTLRLKRDWDYTLCPILVSIVARIVAVDSGEAPFFAGCKTRAEEIWLLYILF